MTQKEKLFEQFDLVCSVKTSNAIACIRDAKSIKVAEWHATETQGELQGIYKGYTDVGEMFGICDELDEEFLKRMWSYRNMITEELAIYMTSHRRKRK